MTTYAFPELSAAELPLTDLGAGPPDPVPLELLWNERATESFEGLQRISIPLWGGIPETGLSTYLAHELHERWVLRDGLAQGGSVTSVAVEVLNRLLAPRALQLAIGTAPGAPRLDGPAMIRDLRRVLRDYRLTRLPGLAVR